MRRNVYDIAYNPVGEYMFMQQVDLFNRYTRNAVADIGSLVCMAKN